MIIYGDITKLDDIEAIVNASNGIGYMGGRVCVKELHKGVAESIQYVTKGAVEKLAKKNVKLIIYSAMLPERYLLQMLQMSTEVPILTTKWELLQ